MSAAPAKLPAEKSGFAQRFRIVAVNQNRFATRCMAAVNIAPAVADHPALRQINVQFARWRDIDCGHTAGCKTILIDRHYAEALKQKPDFSAGNLAGAADIILRESKQFNHANTQRPQNKNFCRRRGQKRNVGVERQSASSRG